MAIHTGLQRGLTFSVLAAALTLAGCKSAAEKANEAAVAQAKQQAAATGQAQQVVWTDPSGKVTTVVVQPPSPGLTTQQVTTMTADPTPSSNTMTSSQPATTSAKPGTSDQPLITPVPANTPAVVPGPVVPVADQPVTTASATGPVISPVNVEIARGTTLAIRVNQRISVKTAVAGDHFSGTVARAVAADGREVIPVGTPVEGRIDESHRRGHFKGASILELRLISMSLGGTRYGLETRENVETKKGKGKRSAAFIGGGAGLGMLVGGVASGGVGLLVGGLAGGGLGTVAGGLTGNRDLVIPAESVVNFKLADDLVVRPL